MVVDVKCQFGTPPLGGAKELQLSHMDALAASSPKSAGWILSVCSFPPPRKEAKLQRLAAGSGFCVRVLTSVCDPAGV